MSIYVLGDQIPIGRTQEDPPMCLLVYVYVGLGPRVLFIRTKEHSIKESVRPILPINRKGVTTRPATTDQPGP